MKKLKITKGSTVEVIAGADKGKKGTVLDLNTNKLKVKVSGVRMQTHFDGKDGLKKLEGFIDYSNVKFSAAAATKKAPVKKKKAASATK